MLTVYPPLQLGPYWPNSGEFDIIEGVHQQSQVLSTLHTSDGCVSHIERRSTDHEWSLADHCIGFFLLHGAAAAPWPSKT